MTKVLHDHQKKSKTLPEEVAKLKDDVKRSNDEIEKLKDIIKDLIGDKKAIIEGKVNNGKES